MHKVLSRIFTYSKPTNSISTSEQCHEMSREICRKLGVTKISGPMTLVDDDDPRLKKQEEYYLAHRELK